jgi:hypothetical protein
MSGDQSSREIRLARLARFACFARFTQFSFESRDYGTVTFDLCKLSFSYSVNYINED